MMKKLDFCALSFLVVFELFVNLLYLILSAYDFPLLGRRVLVRQRRCQLQFELHHDCSRSVRGGAGINAYAQFGWIFRTHGDRPRGE